MEPPRESRGAGAVNVVKRRDPGGMPVPSLEGERQRRSDGAAAHKAHTHHHETWKDVPGKPPSESWQASVMTC